MDLSGTGGSLDAMPVVYHFRSSQPQLLLHPRCGGPFHTGLTSFMKVQPEGSFPVTRANASCFLPQAQETQGSCSGLIHV